MSLLPVKIPTLELEALIGQESKVGNYYAKKKERMNERKNVKYMVISNKSNIFCLAHTVI